MRAAGHQSKAAPHFLSGSFPATQPRRTVSAGGGALVVASWSAGGGARWSWRPGPRAVERWSWRPGCASELVEAEKHFRRVRGYRDLQHLVGALDALAPPDGVVADVA